MIETLLWAILIVLTFNFSYMISTQVFFPFVITIIVVVLVYIIGNIKEKKGGENSENEKN